MEKGRIKTEKEKREEGNDEMEINRGIYYIVKSSSKTFLNEHESVS